MKTWSVKCSPTWMPAKKRSTVDGVMKHISTSLKGQMTTTVDGHATTMPLTHSLYRMSLKLVLKEDADYESEQEINEHPRCRRFSDGLDDKCRATSSIQPPCTDEYDDSRRIHAGNRRWQGPDHRHRLEGAHQQPGVMSCKPRTSLAPFSVESRFSSVTKDKSAVGGRCYVLRRRRIWWARQGEPAKAKHCFAPANDRGLRPRAGIVLLFVYSLG